MFGSLSMLFRGKFSRTTKTKKKQKKRPNQKKKKKKEIGKEVILQSKQI